MKRKLIILSLLAVIIILITAFLPACNASGCGNCGDAECSHKNLSDEWVIINDATCSEEGLMHKYCVDCEALIETVVIPATNKHVEGLAVKENEVAATCKDEGTYDEVVYCSVCDKELSRETKTIDNLTTHTWDNGEVTKETSCKEAGEKTFTCSVCKTTKTEEIDKLTTHTPNTVVKENEVAATCKDEGTYDEVVYCSVCDKELSRETKTVDNLTTHTWDNGEVTKETSCKEAGEKTFTCSVCKTTKTEEIDKLTTHTPNTVVKENEVAATCKDEGSYDEVVYCSVCDKELSREGKIIEKEKHTETIIDRIEPTYTTEGKTEGIYCVVCKEIIVAPETIPMLVHTYTTEKVEPTCTEQGYTIYTCIDAGCSTSYKDDYVPALGHKQNTVKENEVAATCKANGSYDEVVYCSVCDKELSREAKTVDKLTTHTWNNGEVTKETSCKEAGEKTFTCSVCKTTKTEEIEKLTTHTPNTEVKENEVAATCKDEGSYDEVVYCSVCDKELSRESKTIDKLTTHTWNNGEVTKETSCKEAGEKTFTCSVCKTTKTEEIEKLTTHTPNTAVKENEVAATCKDEGSYDEVVYCSVCEKELSRIKKESNFAEHQYSEGVCSGCDTLYNTGLAFELTEEKNAYIVSVGECEDKNIVIPSKYNGLPVTAIADNAFANCTFITSLSIPSSIRHIGAYAFKGCTGIQSIYYGAYLCDDFSSESLVFEDAGSKNITVTVGVDVQKIPAQFLRGINGIVDVVFADESVCASIGNNAFDGVSLGEINLPDELIVIEPYAFANTKNINAITIPKGVFAIEPNAFRGSSISSVGFSNQEGWYRTATQYALTGTDVSVDNATNNALNLAVNAAAEYFYTTKSTHTHNYDEIDKVEATCSSDGEKILRCDACRVEVRIVLKATGHSVDMDSAVNVPCTQSFDGSIECSQCGEMIEIDIVNTVHNPRDIEFDTVEYCGSQQIGTISCKDCKEILQTFGHNYQLTIVQATCISDGEKKNTCINCGKSNVTVIKAMGHIDGEWETRKTATCSEDGEEILSCAVCAAQISSRALDKKTHVYTSIVTDSGVFYECQDCSYNYVEAFENNSFTISFETNGGSDIPVMTVGEGKEVELPAPTKDGYEFLGWYTDSELENVCTSTQFYSDTTLYACWKQDKITAEVATNILVTDVDVDYVFDVKSTVRLSNSNLASYVNVTDTSDKRASLYIKSVNDSVYTIAGRDYKEAQTYMVTVDDAVTLLGVEGNELWFTVRGENETNIKYKEGVKFTAATYVYGLQQDDDQTLLFLTEDLLNVGDITVIYGDTTDDILTVLKILSEGQFQSLSVYVIEAASEQAFEQYEVYYNGELNVENIDFDENLEENLIEAVKQSEIYAHAVNAATAVSGQIGNYYYDYNGMEFKPKFSASGSKIFVSIDLKFHFDRMNVDTRKVEQILTLGVVFSNTLEYKANIHASWFDNFSFVLESKNTFSIKLYATLGDSKLANSSKELSFFMKKLKESQANGSNDKLDSSVASQGKETVLGSHTVWFYGIGIKFQISNIFNFSAVGQMGLEVSFVNNLRVGIANTPGKGLHTIKDTSSEVNMNFYALGKIEVSDMICMKVSLSLCGVLEVYANLKVGPVLMVGGMFTIQGLGSGETYTTGAGVINFHVRIEANVGARAVINILWWKATVLDVNYRIFQNNITLLQFGKDEVPLYFAKRDESFSFDLCNSTKNIDSLIDKTLTVQSIQTLNTKNVTASSCRYEIVGDANGLAITEKGILSIKDKNIKSATVRIKVSSSGVFKYVTLNITNKHSYTAKVTAPTCTKEGYTTYTCGACGNSYVADKVKANGHNYTAVVTEPTCTKEGYTTYTCQYGDHTYVGDYVDAKGHSYNAVVTAPTCTEKGYTTYVCKHNDHTYVGNYVNATGHKYKAVVTAPTCTKEGYTTYTCGACKDSYVADKVKANGHSYNATVTAPTCTEKGYTTYTCKYNDHTYVGDYVDATGHSFNNMGVCVDCSAQSSDSLEYELKQDGYHIVGIGDFTGSHLVITSKHDNIDVVAIASEAFKNCTNIESVEIPDSVTSIGKSAFLNCSSLTSITIPFVGATKDGTSNTHFGYIFGASSDSYNKYCVPTSLRTVIITGGTSIGEWAFYNCSGLTSIVIGDSVTSIGDSAFFSCSSLTSIEIPNSVTSIGDSAFRNCSSLESIEIPDSVTSIGNYAFSIGSSLTSIEIPNSVTSIGDGAFEDCSSLTSVTFGENSKLTSIGGYAFQYCDSLTSIEIPDSVTSIGVEVIDGCYSLIKVNYLGTIDKWVQIEFSGSFFNVFDDIFYINDKLLTEIKITTVTKINNYAFANLCSLTSIVIGGSVTSIGDYAFLACGSLTSVEISAHVTSIGNRAFHACDRLKSIEIPASVTSIGNHAFDLCGLTSIKIPASVTSIGDGAFNQCRSIASIVVDKGNKVYHSAGNCLIETNTKTLIAGCKNSIIPSDGSVTSIGNYAFDWSASLTRIEIPDSVTSIGNGAFHACGKLTSVTFKDPTGWYVTETEGATSGTDVDLSDPTQNGTYLNSTYCDYYWYRKAN